MAKLIRALEFHNPMIQSLRMPVVAPCFFLLIKHGSLHFFLLGWNL